MKTQADLKNDDIRIPVARGYIGATAAIPQDATTMVVFAHGSGSSRYSGRNRYVASRLSDAGFGTFLMDLLTPEEERIDIFTTEYRFDIVLLAERLIDATQWMRREPNMRHLGIGYFGASTGAAAALIAAAQLGAEVKAVVSRGGRPDLAGTETLSRVVAPTLLIVGGDDRPVIAMNREAQVWMKCRTELAIIPGATHLFEELGTLEEVADLAVDWFKEYSGPIQTR